MTRLDHFHDYWLHVNERLRTTGGRVLDLGMGMPPPTIFKTPAILLRKLHESIDAGDFNLYVPPEGEADCLQEIVEHENSILPSGAERYTREHVMLVPGGIQAFSLILSVLAGRREDQVLVPSPSYFSLTAQSEERGETVTLPSDEAFNFSIRELESVLPQVKRLRLMWFCQPNNPTGLYIPTDELSRLIGFAHRYDAYVVLDESCDNYRFMPLYTLPENISDLHVIRIRTFSKDPNFAGYRLGYILASPAVLDRIKRIAPIHYGNPTVMATRAITTEFRIRNRKIHDADHEQVNAENFQLMKHSRDFLYERLKNWNQVEEVILPEACYYMYARFRYPDGSRALFTRLVAEENLNVVPGGVFGAPDDQAWLRICFARTPDVLADGLERLRRVVASRS